MAIALAAGCGHTAAGAGAVATTGAGVDERPGQLLGPGAQLSVAGDLLAGRINGGRYDLKMVAGGAAGSGPLGAIDVHVAQVAQGYDVEGIWNGARISFVVSKNAIRGSALRQVSGEDPGLESCSYDVEKLWRRTVYAGRETCPGLDTPVRFDVQPANATGLDDQTTAVLIIAYLLAPPIAA
jgi:hypothetical protein